MCEPEKLGVDWKLRVPLLYSNDPFSARPSTALAAPLEEPNCTILLVPVTASDLAAITTVNAGLPTRDDGSHPVRCASTFPLVPLNASEFLPPACM